MIVLISGAKKNVGDFLIVDRAYQLLKKYVEDDIIILNRFNNLDDKLDILNSARAIILGGGPAYTHDVFPNIYPFFKFYDSIKTPIYPMGLGWSGKHFNEPEKFTFTEESINYLGKIHHKIKYSSCRDSTTLGILQKNGTDNVLMTGCPVWYDLTKMNQRLTKNEIKNIVITTGASQALVFQTLSIIKLIRNLYKKATIYLSYHRGILPDRNTPPRKGLAYTSIAVLAQKYGVKVRDVSGSVEKLDFYKECDLHIGYRVHAHLMFLSNRKPSILINEDGRGIGMNNTLGLPIFNFNDSNLIDSIKTQLEIYQNDKFEDFNKTFSFIDKNFEVMKMFLNGIVQKSD